MEADLDKEQTDTLAANNLLRAEWEQIRARYPGTDLDFSGELDDINESLDAMGPLFLLGVGLICTSHRHNLSFFKRLKFQVE